MKLCVFSHVDWRWLKQRPHWLAECAQNAGHDVLFLYRPHPGRMRLPRNASPVKRVPLLPTRLRQATALSLGVQRRYASAAIRAYEPDAIVVTHPKLMPILPRVADGSQIVYDCMDDAVAMAPESDRRAIGGFERALVDRADLVIASSLPLQRHIMSLGSATPVRLVRNGTSMRARVADRAVDNDIAYVGTLGPWLDYPMMQDLAEAVPQLSFRLVGPSSCHIPKHPAFVKTGSVEHDKIPAAVSGSSGLILPFKLNDIVLSVDPVKLYEYIALGLPVLVRDYPAVEPFKDFVGCYRSYDEALALCRAAVANQAEVAGASQRQAFLDANSWMSRWSKIEERLLG